MHVQVSGNIFFTHGSAYNALYSAEHSRYTSFMDLIISRKQFSWIKKALAGDSFAVLGQFAKLLTLYT